MNSKEKYYSISFTGDHKEYDSIDSAKAAKGLFVVLESWEKWDNTAFGVTYENKKFIYSFIQNGLTNKHAEIGPSKLYITNISRARGYDRDNLQISFSDSTGLLIEKPISPGVRIDGISKAVKFIIDINTAGDYEKYKLKRENHLLKEKIQELERELSDILNKE